MFKSIDWVYLRRPMVIFGILTVSAFVFYYGGIQYQDLKNLNFNAVKNGLSASHSKLNKKSKEIALVDAYLERYHTLVDTAFIGEERRLSWIESMETTNKEIKLPIFKYTIKAQSDFIRPGIKSNKHVKALTSQMDLNLGVLHEEDIFHVFNLLDKNVQSHFVVDACEISKGRNSELKIDKQNFNVHCVVNWVHLEVKTL